MTILEKLLQAKEMIATGFLPDYPCLNDNYKLIKVDLSK